MAVRGSRVSAAGWVNSDSERERPAPQTGRQHSAKPAAHPPARPRCRGTLTCPAAASLRQPRCNAWCWPSSRCCGRCRPPPAPRLCCPHPGSGCQPCRPTGPGCLAAACRPGGGGGAASSAVELSSAAWLLVLPAQRVPFQPAAVQTCSCSCSSPCPSHQHTTAHTHRTARKHTHAALPKHKPAHHCPPVSGPYHMAVARPSSSSKGDASR